MDQSASQIRSDTPTSMSAKSTADGDHKWPIYSIDSATKRDFFALERHVRTRKSARLSQWMRLDVKGTKKYDEFIESNLWQPYFRALVEHWINPITRTLGPRGWCISFEKLEARIIFNETNGRNRVLSELGVSGRFDPLDWVCCVFRALQEHNTIDESGLFFERHEMTDHQKYCAIWTILKCQLFRTSPEGIAWIAEEEQNGGSGSILSERRPNKRAREEVEHPDCATLSQIQWKQRATTLLEVIDLTSDNEDPKTSNVSIKSENDLRIKIEGVRTSNVNIKTEDNPDIEIECILTSDVSNEFAGGPIVKTEGVPVTDVNIKPEHSSVVKTEAFIPLG